MKVHEEDSQKNPYGLKESTINENIINNAGKIRKEYDLANLISEEHEKANKLQQTLDLLAAKREKDEEFYSMEIQKLKENEKLLQAQLSETGYFPTKVPSISDRDMENKCKELYSANETLRLKIHDLSNKDDEHTSAALAEEINYWKDQYKRLEKWLEESVQSTKLAENEKSHYEKEIKRLKEKIEKTLNSAKKYKIAYKKIKKKKDEKPNPISSA